MRNTCNYDHSSGGGRELLSVNHSSGGEREMLSGNQSSADCWSQSNGLQVAAKEVGWRVRGMIG